MFQIENVSKTYNGKAKSKKGNADIVKAVDSLSLTVNNGEIFGFLGPNGAGKTTSIRMITGILQADEGDIKLDGISIKERPIAAKRTFAFVPDNPETFSRLKAIEYLNFICDVYKIPAEDRAKKISELCEKFGLKEVLKNKISSFSHGMKQKLFLIASLITDPQNWILDEPMVGLDPEAAFIVKEMMRERAKAGKTVFFSTHVMEVAEKLCDRIGIIKKGKLVFVGTMDELKTQHGQNGESLEDIFINLVKAGE
ncbi:MAG: ABC transporter ATP-binding protein [Treponema sp.]|nr:ABC transporter ATP-binding protein [Treponema sp.]MCI5665961.1 ABC transporter ATP-binding protein [Spirochaetia bacterium]MDD7767969.1 ABC transporter ATP-binding protein [Treponema sp.]MDY3131054.1 ABC transporter ATP-binding protein [Treponema sp.]